MPDRRQHRGRHPADAAQFAPAAQEALRAATSDLSWLLSRGYSDRAAIKLVGDRRRLTLRQRHAVVRAACADDARVTRRARRRSLGDGALRGERLVIDGFNCLITLEAALSGGLVIVGRDGAHRDLSALHGSYRKIAETPLAIRAAGRVVARAEPAKVTWYLDAPVSNSGRLKTLLREEAEAAGWRWDVVLEARTDHALKSSGAIVATSDGFILDRCAAWVDLPDAAIAAEVPHAWLVEL
jgi:hypothetical protein